MAEREKVVSEFERCIGSFSPADTSDEYFMHVCKRALELLKGQESVEAKVMGESKSHGSWWFACGACSHAIDPEDNFCRECGRKVKWDDEA